MYRQLSTSDGQRKYLTADELARFIETAELQERGEVRTFCLGMAYTGCRISEALELTPERIDLSTKTIIFRTLKQRRQDVYRAVPVPEGLLDTLDLVHRIRKARRGKKGQPKIRLWPWGRFQAYKHICAVMNSADISGPHATPKGLRHGFGVQGAAQTRNPRMLQKWMGHRSIETTMIYMDAMGDEERELASRMWATPS